MTALPETDASSATTAVGEVVTRAVTEAVTATPVSRAPRRDDRLAGDHSADALMSGPMEPVARHHTERAAGAETQRPRVTVVLPCYNEQDHVLAELDRVTAAMDASSYTYELLVIDDASTDRTLEVLRAAAPRFPHMRLMPFRRNGGSGTARRIGTREALGEIVVWTDADMTYPNERIPEFVAYLDEHPETDQVVGARTSEEGTYKLLRVPAKWVIRKVAEVLSGTKIPDLNSGLRAFRREVSLPYLRLLPPGFSCVTTITLSFLSNQHPVDYLAIGYAKRAGQSKFHPFRDAYRYILQVLRMVMYFNPIKVLMPLALWAFAIGFVKLVVDQIRLGWGVPSSTMLVFLTAFQIAVLALIGDLVARSRSD